MSDIRLSIIVPVYNMERYVEKCIDSIIAQTYKPIEIILVDDGATDDSSNICDRYTSYSNVKVIHKPNGGLISARKAGLASAIGEYIGFVDADDWVEPDMYGCLTKKADEYDADIVSCSYYVDSEYSQNIVWATHEERVVKGTEECQELYKGVLAKDFDTLNARNITPSVCNKIFKKELLLNTYTRIDERIIWDEDAVTVLSTVLDSDCIVFVPEILYHYRYNTSSMSHKLNRSVLQNYLYVYDEIIRINNEHKGILNNQIPFFSVAAARICLEVGFGVRSSRKYIFPFDKIEKGKKIIIYGAGNVGRCFYNEVSQLSYAERLCLTDSDPQKWSEDVMNPDEAFSGDFDTVLIAVESEATAQRITEDLIKRGIPEEAIVWHAPVIDNGAFLFWRDN